MGTKTKGENGLGAAKYRDAGKGGGGQGGQLYPPPLSFGQSIPIHLGADYAHQTTTYPPPPPQFFGRCAYIQQKRGMHRTVWSCTMSRNYFSGSFFFTCIVN